MKAERYAREWMTVTGVVKDHFQVILPENIFTDSEAKPQEIIKVQVQLKAKHIRLWHILSPETAPAVEDYDLFGFKGFRVVAMMQGGDIISAWQENY